MSRFIIIAHRGASGYLPEHTLPAKAMAYAMGADYLEQDVVATRDGQLLVLHDIHLDRVTDVAERFPDRARGDGRFYVRDFDLDEIRTLQVTERLDGAGLPVYPGRFPPRSGRFRVNTLAEELELVAGLNHATGRKTGVYPEIKRPAWHQADGFDITPAVLDELARHGYETAEDAIFLQCFDGAEVLRIRNELGCKLKLVRRSLETRPPLRRGYGDRPLLSEFLLRGRRTARGQRFRRWVHCRSDRTPWERKPR